MIKGKPFVIKEKSFGFSIRCLNSGKRLIGYIIELIDITDLLDNQTDCNAGMVK